MLENSDIKELQTNKRNDDNYTNSKVLNRSKKQSLQPSQSASCTDSRPETDEKENITIGIILIIFLFRIYVVLSIIGFLSLLFL